MLERNSGREATPACGFAVGWRGERRGGVAPAGSVERLPSSETEAAVLQPDASAGKVEVRSVPPGRARIRADKRVDEGNGRNCGGQFQNRGRSIAAEENPLRPVERG